MMGEQKIYSKAEKINELIVNKGFVKVKAIFMWVKEANAGKILLTPANYNIMQFVNDIKKKYQVDASQGLFLYVNSEKLMGQETTMKELSQKYLNANGYVQIKIATIDIF